MNINLLKPNYQNALDKSSSPVIQGKKNSEYVPLFSALHYLNDFSLGVNHLSSNTNQTTIVEKLNKKYNGKLLSPYLSKVSSYLMNNYSELSSGAKSNLDLYKNKAKEWIFSPIINNYIPTYINRDSDYYENMNTSFIVGGYKYMRRYNFVGQDINCTLGYMGDIDVSFNINSPIIVLMVKRENIPFVRANWLLNIPIPENAVECWVLDTLDTAQYPRQTIRKNAKTGIFPKMEEQGIKLVNKTQDELNSMWWMFTLPIFKTPLERKKWSNKQVVDFLQAEKVKLGIAPKVKAKYNFSSVKTKIPDDFVKLKGIYTDVEIATSISREALVAENIMYNYSGGIRETINQGNLVYYNGSSVIPTPPLDEENMLPF